MVDGLIALGWDGEKSRGSGSHIVTALVLRRPSILSACWSLRAAPSDSGAGGGEGVASSCDEGDAVGVSVCWLVISVSRSGDRLSFVGARGGGVLRLVCAGRVWWALVPVLLCLRVVLGFGGAWLSGIAEEERLERVSAAGGAWVILPSDGGWSSGVRRGELDVLRELVTLAAVGAGW